MRLLTRWLVLALPTAALLTACPWPPGDDDDDDDNTVSPTPQPTPTAPPQTPTPIVEQTTISGQVIAIDATTGDPIDAQTYLARGGVIVVYALPDPSDLVHPVGKATLEEPGFYTLDVPVDSGPLYILAAVDMDGNRVISPFDITREAILSPVNVAAEPTENVDIILDLSARGGGGGTVPAPATFTGNVIYDSELPAEVAVVAYRGDYSGWYWGMSRRDGSGEYWLSIPMWGATTSIVGYADADGNQVFEPSDPAGLPEGNPYELGPSGRTGVDILIEGVGPAGLPVPIPYVTVSGTVTTDDSYNGSPILLRLIGSTGKVVYAQMTLSSPGDFALRVPGFMSGLTISGITDTSGDGALDTSLDANGSVGPFDVGSTNVGGKNLHLASPVDPQTGIEGTLSYSGAVSPSDQVVLAVFADQDMSDGPIRLVYYSATFPLAYEVLGLEEKLSGASSGSFYLAAALDVGGNFAGSPSDEDILGAYSSDGSTLHPITVTLDHVTDNINFTIGNWSQDVNTQ